MKFGAISTAAAAASIFASSVLADLDPIVIKGSKFFYKTNGTEFFIKGVAYQQDYSGNGTSATTANGYTDPLADSASCARDIPLLQELQTNVIRVYAVDPTKDHSACMGMLQDAGIYVISDLSAPGDSINRNDPAWDDTLYARYSSVIDSLQSYSNVMGFFAGNEVSNQQNNTAASAFVKAAVRDMKAYIAQQGYRTIPIGYAADDDATIRDNIEAYFNCGDQSTAIDFFGLNIYEWCGNSTYQTSGYEARTQELSKYSIPAFFAEYGCNTDGVREFSEVQALFGPQMTPVWSGGIVYMYFQEANDYGLVSVDGSSASKLPDFTNLQSQIAMITPSGVSANAYTPTNTVPSSCPTIGQSGWQAASALPPTPNAGLCECMYKALSCVPSDEVNDNNIGQIFGVLCGLSDGAQCDGIAANGTTGDYGAYGMCNPTQQLGWALNNYASTQAASGNSNACSFSGSATTQSFVNPSGTCAALISQAGAQGTGTVTSKPSGTGSSGSSGGSGSSGSSGSSSSSGLAAPSFGPMASLNLGAFQFAIYTVVAVFTGAGMILL